VIPCNNYENIKDQMRHAEVFWNFDNVINSIYGYGSFRALYVVANKQAALMSLMRLQCMGINEDQILNMERFLQEYIGQRHAQQSTP
jgi:hypothetical protein